MTATIKVVVNGEAREIPAGLTVAALLGHLRMGTDRVAVERNLEILPRARWNDTAVETGDCFEIVHFVGGGESGPDRAGGPHLSSGHTTLRSTATALPSQRKT